MGLLDQLGGLMGQGQAGGGDVMAMVQQLVAANGGMAGLVQKFQQGGLADVAASWVGQGQNLPVSAAQIQQVLGAAQLDTLAGKLGMDGQQLSAQLAQHLPGIIDALTPDGQLPQGNDLLAQGAGLLQGLFKR